MWLPALSACQTDRKESRGLSQIDLASPDLTSPPPEVATHPSDEICKRDEERLGRLSKSPTSDEAMRFLAELR